VTRRLAGGSVFEATAGYSRAVRHGEHIAVSGTAAIGPGGVLHPDDAYAQTVEALGRALAAATELGATRETVLRTRLLLAPNCDWQEVVRAHREAFVGDRPANTTYFVAGFVPQGVLVEVELDALAADE
jgi:enamine deaminase RidA (YjgF/YER057c/UK114 family)